MGKPELGNGADCISLMRGMERLAFDLPPSDAEVVLRVQRSALPSVGDATASSRARLHRPSPLA